jgi:hypothetical protein
VDNEDATAIAVRNCLTIELVRTALVPPSPDEPPEAELDMTRLASQVIPALAATPTAYSLSRTHRQSAR